MIKWRTHDADAEWAVYHQVVLPKSYRNEVLNIAHEKLLGGHFGVCKTRTKILQQFFWPGIWKDIAEFCKTCHVCQVIGKSSHDAPPVPLHPFPVADEAFTRVIMDCVGRLPKTKSGCEYILTIMCSTTRFPEAIPLRNIKARTVSNASVKFLMLFGLPKEVQSDQGSNFMSGIFQQVMHKLGVRQIKSSLYHLESQGALERFHASLKTMIRTYVEQHEKDWDVGLPMLMFAARESVQESLGFSPNDLVFGHHVRGPLKLLKEQCLNDDDDSVKVNLLDYVSKFRTRLHEAGEIAKKKLSKFTAENENVL